MERETHALLGIKVVVRTHRKHGNGAKGSGRKGQTGKCGSIFQIGLDGTEARLACFKAPTFKALSRKLFATGFIPRNIPINPNGETLF